ncbi:MAG: 3-oxoacyl-ACP reductase family protein [Dehalobacterium sp.]
MDNSKAILVTGSSRGIGRELVKFFAQKGHKVAVNYAKSENEAQSLYDEISSYNKDIILVKADISDRLQVKNMFQKIVQKFGRIDVLINNAGINMDASFMDMSDEKWQRVIDTNLTGNFICSQEFVFAFNNAGNESSGHIINIASNSSITGRKNGANYCSAKAGVVTLTKCLALELAPSIKVNCIMLGYVDTEEVMERYMLHDKNYYDRMMETIPLRRLGTSDDVCKAANFIINESSYMTGQSLFINGGNYMG